MRRTGPRGTLTTIAIWLLIGAAVNIAVAWGSSLWESTRYGRVFDMTMESGCRSSVAPWPSTPPEGWSEDPRVSTFGADRPWASCTQWVSMWPMAEGSVMASMTRTYHVTRWEVGFPFKSLSWEGWGRMDPNGQYVAIARPLWQQGIEVGSSSMLFGVRSRRLPLQADWPMFGLGAMFWGALLWFVSGGLGRWCRTRRAEKGSCVHCAYDRVGLNPSTPCPECGSPA